MAQRTRRSNPGTQLKNVEVDDVDQALALLPGYEHDRAQVQAMVLACEAGDIFPNEAPPNVKVATCAYAMIWGLDAALKEVIPFKSMSRGVDKWGIYVTSDGQNTWAHKFADYRGTTHRLLSDTERAALLIDEPLAFEVTTIREGFLPFVAYGTATNVAEVAEWNQDGRGRNRKHVTSKGTTNPVELENPTAMALARGYRRSLRRAYPVNMATADRMFARMATEGLSFSAVHDNIVDTEAIDPPRPKDTRWAGFWITVRDRWPEEEKADLYEILESSGQDLASGTDKDGVIEKSMTKWAGTPEGALSILEAHFDEDVVIEAEEPAAAEPPRGPTGLAIWDRLTERFESSSAVELLLGADFHENAVVSKDVLAEITKLVPVYEMYLPEESEARQASLDSLARQLLKNDLKSLLQGALETDNNFTHAWVEEVSAMSVSGGVS